MHSRSVKTPRLVRLILACAGEWGGRAEHRNGFIPYGVSDYGTRFATVQLDEVLAAMQ